MTAGSGLSIEEANDLLTASSLGIILNPEEGEPGESSGPGVVDFLRALTFAFHCLNAGIGIVCDRIYDDGCGKQGFGGYRGGYYKVNIRTKVTSGYMWCIIDFFPRFGQQVYIKEEEE
jgi:hypothetical protein